MAHIKQTKNELKAQREALGRYERFLPMLQLKKMQLQAEMQLIEAHLAAKQAEGRAVREAWGQWVRLLSEPIPLDGLTKLAAVEITPHNVAGVIVPVFKSASFERAGIDLYLTPPWLDDALDRLEELIRLEIESRVLREQHRRIGAELRTTSLRVNLFEKVKIPETRETIRTIRIVLGDRQTAGVARAKYAKGRSLDVEAFGAVHAGAAEPAGEAVP